MTNLTPIPDDRRRALATTGELPVPALIAAAGEDAARHFVNFFIASIRNPHTRRAYARHVRNFMDWCEARGVSDVRGIATPHVSAYIELMSRSALEAASVKQSLSALRMLFDWLVVHQVVPANPAAVVRGPRLSVSEGVTPVLGAADVARILEGIPTDNLVGVRDRALIGLMAYTFARVGAAVLMDVKDFFPQGTGYLVRLREKGGKRKTIAAHHLLVQYLCAYIDAAGIADEADAPLFRTAKGKTKRLTMNRMTQDAAWYMLQRRARGPASRRGCATTPGAHRASPTS